MKGKTEAILLIMDSVSLSVSPKLTQFECFALNPFCGDKVEFHFNIQADRFCDVWRKSSGCLVSQGCAGLVCEYLEGKPYSEICATSAETALGFPLTLFTPHRSVCCRFGFDAISDWAQGFTSPSSK